MIFHWCPETASKEQALKYKLEDNIDTAAAYGILYYVQARTVADLDEKTVESRMKKFSDLAAQVAKNEKKN